MEIQLPSDKSWTHRFLMLSPFFYQEIEMKNYSFSHDLEATRTILEEIGLLKMTSSSPKERKIILKSNWELFSKSLDNFFYLNCANSGTTARLMMGYLSGLIEVGTEIELDGDLSLRKRPMKRVTEPLGEIFGLDFSLTRGEYLPLKLKKDSLFFKRNRWKLDLPSAQVKSAILLAFLFLGKGNFVLEEDILSRDHTERMLLYFFPEKVKREKKNIFLFQLPLLNKKEVVPFLKKSIFLPGDISSALYFLGLFLASSFNKIVFKKLLWNERRNRAFYLLKKLGIIKFNILRENDFLGEKVVDLEIGRGKGSQIKKVVFQNQQEIVDLIDELPLLTILLLSFGIEVEVRNAGELRVKESDRIEALVKNLSSIGFKTKVYPDGYQVVPSASPNLSVRIDTFFDHRIYMSFRVMELLINGKFDYLEKESFQISLPQFEEFISDIFQ